jgi:hypothetical protein
MIREIPVLAKINVSKPYKKRRLKQTPARRIARRNYKLKMKQPKVRMKQRRTGVIYRRKNKQALKRRSGVVKKQKSLLPPSMKAAVMACDTLYQKVLATGTFVPTEHQKKVADETVEEFKKNVAGGHAGKVRNPAELKSAVYEYMDFIGLPTKPGSMSPAVRYLRDRLMKSGAKYDG